MRSRTPTAIRFWHRSTFRHRHRNLRRRVTVTKKKILGHQTTVFVAVPSRRSARVGWRHRSQTDGDSPTVCSNPYRVAPRRADSLPVGFTRLTTLSARAPTTSDSAVVHELQGGVRVLDDTKKQSATRPTSKSIQKRIGSEGGTLLRRRAPPTTCRSAARSASPLPRTSCGAAALISVGAVEGANLRGAIAFRPCQDVTMGVPAPRPDRRCQRSYSGTRAAKSRSKADVWFVHVARLRRETRGPMAIVTQAPTMGQKRTARDPAEWRITSRRNSARSRRLELKTDDAGTRIEWTSGGRRTMECGLETKRLEPCLSLGGRTLEVATKRKGPAS